jgi:UDP-2,3-diacylglucosamine hydrolase
MSTYFISDLHLQTTEPKITELFLKFLSTQARQADALYILGDLFEVWIGDDDNCAFARKIKGALKTLTDHKVPVYVMRGNRDFIIGERFATDTGAIILPDPTVVTIYGQQILLMHGDLLCTDDEKYQAFRRKVYRPSFQKWALAMPLLIRRGLAAFARYKSKKHTSSTSRMVQDVNHAEVERYMREHKVALLIHGHTHRPATHDLLIDSSPAQRIVLAAWHDQGYVLELKPNREFTRFVLN